MLSLRPRPCFSCDELELLDLVNVPLPFPLRSRSSSERGSSRISSKLGAATRSRCCHSDMPANISSPLRPPPNFQKDLVRFNPALEACNISSSEAIKSYLIFPPRPPLCRLNRCRLLSSIWLSTLFRKLRFSVQDATSRGTV